MAEFKTLKAERLRLIKQDRVDKNVRSSDILYATSSTTNTRKSTLTPTATRRMSHLKVSTASDICFTHDVTTAREGPHNAMGNKARAAYTTYSKDTFRNVFESQNEKLSWNPERAKQLHIQETKGRGYDILSGNKV